MGVHQSGEHMNRIAMLLGDGAKPPTKKYDGDAGWDLYTSADKDIQPGVTEAIPTGIRIAMPPGMWMQITPRSSTLPKHGLHVIEGVIDNGYRGEMFVRVYNPSGDIVHVTAGSRLAQMIPHKILDLRWAQVNDLPSSDRDESGFGSTGV